MLAITGQSGAGMVHDTLAADAYMPEAEALALLPSGSTIQAIKEPGWCVIALNVNEQIARAFSDFTWPLYIFGWRDGPTVLLRRSSLGRFCGLWETWA